MKTDKRLGNKNAGRKKMPKSELKVPVQVYLEAYKIKEIGGKESARNVALSALEKEYILSSNEI